MWPIQLGLVDDAQQCVVGKTFPVPTLHACPSHRASILTGQRTCGDGQQGAISRPWGGAWSLEAWEDALRCGQHSEEASEEDRKK